MSKELEFFPEAIPYWKSFTKANMSEFKLHMREYQTYPEGGYSSFYRDNEVVQVLINIYYNIIEKFGNLTIPEEFPSPAALVRNWQSFYTFLKKDDELFNDVYSKQGKKKYEFPYSPVLSVIDEDRHKVLDLLEHILSMSEVSKYLKSNSEIQDAPKLSFIKAPSRVFDIVIITAISKEHIQIKNLLQNGSEPEFKDPSRTTYFQGEFSLSGGKKAKVLLACANQMGMISSSSLATKVIYRFQPRVVAMCGIAAGIQGGIGDIMIPDIIWDYGSGKNSIEKLTTFFGRVKHQEIFLPYRYPISIKQDLIGKLIRLSKETDIKNTIQTLGNHITFDEKPRNLNIHIGPFVSGSAVVANDKIREQIKNQDGKLIGFDMEAFGIAYATIVADIIPQPIAFVVKSICDFGDMKKENPNKNLHQDYAAFTSAIFLHNILTNFPDLFDL